MNKIMISILSSAVLLFSGTILHVNASCSCYDVVTTNTVEMTDIQFQSDERYPQTIIHDIVIEFLASEDQGKQKKVLVLGYDGYREDALENIFNMEQSAIKSVARSGGLYHSYAGADGNQDTSTAPGWLSILNGTWAYQLGVHDNTGKKPSDVSTFLDDAIVFGYSSTFIASWAPHFDVTYREDIERLNRKTHYQQMSNDVETLETLHAALSDTSLSAYDIMFATLEYTDHAGHSIGYGNGINEYVGASQQVDLEAFKLLQIIQNRNTYQEENWLILITTDHGGIGTSHGGHSEEETNTWFAVNKNLL